eukprot:TRINITY_DN4056_c0_g1_i5.p1 TRINITY_DN4056_c0_g1~~TRINITY_DN4056_c0_g1_i5.p1  ORF type:complete len:265 (+),score=74.07 TRINITY_DN4056_c0_g1_i5:48-797(+)
MCIRDSPWSWLLFVKAHDCGLPCIFNSRIKRDINILMGNCCRSSQRNEGIKLDEKVTPMPDLSGKAILTESDVVMILKRAYVQEYNTKLYEKRNLQSRRAKLLGNKKPSNEYLELIEETKKLENEIIKETTSKVLEDCKVDPRIFERSKEALNKEKLQEEVAKGLMEEIKELQSKLGLSQEKIANLNEKYRTAYNEANFMLSSYPDTAQRLAVLFENELYLDYTDFMAADMLYNEFQLLPIEIASFAEE